MLSSKNTKFFPVIIIAIEKYMKSLGKKSFNFSKATNGIVIRNIKNLNTGKAPQFNDVPAKYIKNLNMFLLQLQLMTIRIVSPFAFFCNVLKLLK